MYRFYKGIREPTIKWLNTRTIPESSKLVFINIGFYETEDILLY